MDAERARLCRGGELWAPCSHPATTYGTTHARWRARARRLGCATRSLTRARAVSPTRRVVSARASRGRDASHTTDHRLPPAVAGRRARIVDSLHGADGRGIGLGRV